MKTAREVAELVTEAWTPTIGGDDFTVKIIPILLSYAQEVREEDAKKCDELEDKRWAYEPYPSPADCASAIRSLEIK